uniref:Mitogen-activated protein kinase binding protein 1 n=1 Tax=Hippocampus comes TaxID=109280 RepID=A0A3Q2Y2I1_HIPCM
MRLYQSKKEHAKDATSPPPPVPTTLLLPSPPPKPSPQLLPLTPPPLSEVPERKSEGPSLPPPTPQKLVPPAPKPNDVTLEKVLGITALGNSCLACDPKTGLVAYPAGCVVVLLNPRKNRQQHLINTSRKTITALSFSQDGKYLVTGESGHLPAVRLWDVSERRQVSELQKHEYGVSCVAFSPDGKHIVSVGNQHDMMVNVWAWKKDVVIAANKVSSKVTGVSFSEDSSYFVTVGNRHVKFWYLDHCKASKASTPMPLLGRSGLLGELRNNFFCDVACGRGQKSESTFCVTFSGLLCEFNGNRMLDKWVDLVAQSLSLSWDRIFCSCADGTVRVFSPLDLRFVCTLPRPHPLGADVAHQLNHLLCSQMDARYPDATAVTYDPISRWLSCVYADHSVFVWDVTDLTRVAKVHSALFHAACVWDLEMVASVRPVCAFLSCSSDSTIRLWHVDERTHVHSRNILSTDLLKIIYTGTSTAALQEAENLTNTDGQPVESRVGVRTICVSPDGKHLASGDRDGILRIHNLSSMEEILKVEAHDAEILCLEYSKPQTGLQLLATASRDRLIHVLDATSDYSLVQTLDEHSSSITAVRFAATDGKVRLISCGADKSIYFRTAHTNDTGTEFRCSHHTVRKTTLYDMGVEPSCKHVAVGCQDVLIFNISNGKQKKLYRGSLCDDGSLLRVQIDPSGQYVAASCSNKNISIFDFRTGECVATMFGHSEIVTGLRFTNDCKHLITPRSPLPCENKESGKRPQYLLLDRGPLKASSARASSPSPGSPQSPCSYMNPTASSMAKSSRSLSVGEGVHIGLDLPHFPKARRSWGDLDVVETSWHPLAAVTPTSSRIPQPKQPLSPRRSLELKAGSFCQGSPTKASSPTVGPACEVASYTGKATFTICSSRRALQLHFSPPQAKRDGSETTRGGWDGQTVIAVEVHFLSQLPYFVSRNLMNARDLLRT